MKKTLFIRGEGLIPRRSAAVIKVLNPSPIPYENNIPRGSAARLLIAAVIFLCAGAVFCQGFGFGPGGAPGGASNPALEKSRAKSEDGMDKLDGLIPMRFFNALDRNPVAGAKIEIAGAGTFTTDAKGKIVFPLPADGAYTLIFSKEGFITTPIDFKIQVGMLVNNWFSVSPGITNKDYRIVLDWGEKPADLDIHFEKTGGNPYHISYLNMKSADDGNTVLDRDDKAGYGPETITVGKTDRGAVYTCWVQDFTNRANPASTGMAKSGAAIRVYSLNRLMHTFNIPADGKGVKWNVFKIENGAVVPVNTVTN